MLALKVMLVVYAVVTLVAVCSALVVPRVRRWLIAHGARDGQWFMLGDEPSGFKQFRDELREQSSNKR